MNADEPGFVTEAILVPWRRFAAADGRYLS